MAHLFQGLTTNQVAQKRKTFGFNELPAEKPKKVWGIILEVIKEPMFVLLIACGVLYIILGDLNEGMVLLATIIIIIFITFYQYQKTEKALKSLKNLSSPRALVIRDGEEIRIAGREVVPGDIVILHEGDRVPADGQLLATQNLVVDESIVSGEAVPVTKSVTQKPTDAKGMVYGGTLVIRGKGYSKITAIGSHTQIGNIGQSLVSIETSETRLQQELKSLIFKLFVIAGVCCVVIIGAFYVVRGNFLHAILNGLAAAMTIIPEEFPVALTVFLALGAWRLSKKKVLTRKPSAIETLGAATILCSDKTGTITQNKMEVGCIYTGNETLYKDTFAQHQAQLSEIINSAFLASNIDSIDPMEKALIKSNQALNQNLNATFTLVKEYPLSKSLLAMTRVVQDPKGQRTLVAAKGAPETIFTLCQLKAADQQKYLNIVENLAQEGYRVIGVAKATTTSGSLPAEQTGFDFQFLGLIGLEDPIRPEVPQAIKECTAAGVKVLMITGDFPTTAQSIAQQIGINTSNHILTGEALAQLSEEELRKQIPNISIVARVVPQQKLRIVRALQANNEIVAMTGDGVNDAPALKAANIGIAMGNKGTDVAREAASLVLLDDNFASIVGAIRLGRKIFDNLQKAIAYIIAIHIPIIGLTLLPAFIRELPILLMPLHIVWLELIIDPICAVAFENEQEEEHIMNRNPRDPEDQFFGGKKMIESVLQGLLLLGMTMAVYFSSIHEGHTDSEVRAITFSSLVIGNVFLILTNLSKTRSIFKIITERNWPVWIILGTALLMLIVVVLVPFFQRIFSFEFPGYTHFISSLLGASAVLVILETIKHFKNKKPN